MKGCPLTENKKKDVLVPESRRPRCWGLRWWASAVAASAVPRPPRQVGGGRKQTKTARCPPSLSPWGADVSGASTSTHAWRQASRPGAAAPSSPRGRPWASSGYAGRALARTADAPPPGARCRGPRSREPPASSHSSGSGLGHRRLHACARRRLIRKKNDLLLKLNDVRTHENIVSTKVMHYNLCICQKKLNDILMNQMQPLLQLTIPRAISIRTPGLVCV